MASVLQEPSLELLVNRLHMAGAAQDEQLRDYFIQRANQGKLSAAMDDASHAFMADKLVALEPPKAEFCHQLCRVLNARRVIEIGTSFGVSTLYLAAAVRANCQDGEMGVVIGTEHEPSKVAAARANFAEAGLSSVIDLREGDLRETLKDLDGPIDFALIDIWTEMARPALELIAPRLRVGSVVCADYTTIFREAYREYFDLIEDPRWGLRTMTLPFDGGFEMTIKVG